MPLTPQSASPASSSPFHYQSPPPLPRFHAPNPAPSPRSPIRPRHSAAKSPASAPPRLLTRPSAPALHHRHSPPADQKSSHMESPHPPDPVATSAPRHSSIR